MTNNRLFLTFLLLVTSACLFAQDEVHFTADRPGMATGTDVIGKGVVQWETGLAYESFANGPHTFTINNSLFRFGLSDFAEFRLGVDYVRFMADETENPVYGFLPVTFGAKLKVYEGEGWVPSVSLMTNLASSRIGSKEFLPSNLAPSLYLLVQHDWTDWLNVGHNIGAEWDGEQAKPTTFAAICFGASITDRLGCFVESYNYFSNEGNEYAFDFGFTCMATSRLQFDVAANFNFQHPKEYYLISVGVVWMIN